MQEFAIARETSLPPEQYIAVLNASGLGTRRPVHDHDRMAAIIGNSNLIVTARHEGRIVGLARCLTDFSFNCYIGDLAVDRAYQGRGIGKALLAAVRAAQHPKTRIYLSSAPESISYYEYLGMERNDRAFRIIPPE